MIHAGIDAGSRAIKVVLLKENEIIAHGVADQGIEQETLSSALFERLLEESGATRTDVARIVATGYGRNLIGFADQRITEITCHAHGVRHLAPETRTLIEIGGQDSKVVRLNPKGGVQDFSMNDRCAAGTGRFLEVVAERLGVRLEDLGAMAGKSGEAAAISSMCVVFAETEIIGLLASGISPEDIVAGVQSAVAKRVAALAGRNIDGPILFTGGVALIPGMRIAMEEALGQTVICSSLPQMTGALGAALMAAR